jgi:hypothetical protein
MIKKLKLLLQGKLPDFNDYLSTIEQLSQAQATINLLKIQLEQKALMQSNIAPIISGFDSNIHEPSDAAERKIYASRVDEFFEDILKDKIKVSIGEVRELLASPNKFTPISEIERSEYDFFLRGMEAGLWKIHEWATVLQGELKNK